MEIGDIEGYRKFTRDIAENRGWEYAEIEGDISLIERLANGKWNENEFLLVEPGKRVAESFDDMILKED
jgi:hypothetical protein